MPLLRDADLAAAFDHAARSYNALVAANPGYHAHLRRSARRLGLPPDGRRLRVLDLGCGTGASTAALAEVLPHADITAVDASAGMLRRAAARSWARPVRFVHAPVERLDEAGVSGPFDAVFAAYLLRNAADPDAVLACARRLLAPHGRLAVHEYALSGRAAHRAVWSAVCGGLVLPAATLLGDGPLFRHLWRSVVTFDTADCLGSRVARAGFERVRVLPLPGWQTGITHTVVGRRPAYGPEAAGSGKEDGEGAGARPLGEGPQKTRAGSPTVGRNPATGTEPRSEEDPR
ncbi:methyltransferase domain-containing protein [Streptomyces sp. BR123]|uniref:methyltransferase domain-containing protein n=1 Tax=Streptomyces sp. BR123 TaxID=2749828 RepID=UPI0015C4D063|nr:methyltransferase domain-containing protein [Streptomyces sp. BR123]NXY94038.1 methyltransferase domain-containing protein [Streptomyces sp. BR123]